MASWVRYNSLKAAGLCPRCGGQRDTQGLTCSQCCVKFAAYNKGYRALRKAAGNPLKTYNPTKSKQYRDTVKRNTLEAYGGAFCACCSEQNIHFLTLDHVNNDGNKHRRGKGRLYASYSNLRAAGFPNDPPLQVLCYNCNNGKRVNNGVCPHSETTNA